MFRWWQKLQDRERLAEVDATLLIARFGSRAGYTNRPPCHWKRVHSIVGELLPYDGDDEGRTTSALPNAEP